MAKGKQRNNKSKNDRKIEQARLLLLDGKLSKREIANIVGIDSGYVYRMASEMKLGQQKNESAEVVEEPEQIEEAVEQGINQVEDTVETPVEEETVDLSADDLKFKIVEDLVAGERIPQVCKKYHISVKMLSDAVNELGYAFSKSQKKYVTVESLSDEDKMAKEKKSPKSSSTKQKKVKPVKVEKKEPETWRDKVTDIEQEKHLICTTFYGRHPIPVKLAVFGKGELTPDEMFDFDWQLKTATEFILNNVEFKNNIPDRDIICYPTGNIQALVSFIMACEKMRVNLTFMQYNSDDKSRDNKQVVFSNYPDGNKRLGGRQSKFTKFIRNFEHVSLYDCTAQQLNKLDEFYSVFIVDMDSEKIERVYFTNNGWELFQNLVEDGDIKDNFAYYLRTIKTNNSGEYYIQRTISKAYSRAHNDR